MEYRHLVNFLMVCEEKSISAAAEKLYISQQGLSKSIKQLEESLGVLLFFRTRHGIEPTEFGATFQKAARSYVSHHDNIIGMVHKEREQAQARLSLGMASGTGDFLPQGFFKEFFLRYPQIILEMKSFADDDCLEAVLEHKIHLAFTPAPIDYNFFESVYTEKRKMFLLAGKKHPLARFSSVRLRELRNHIVITLNSRTHPQGLLMDICRHNGVQPRILLNGAENNLVRELCGSGRALSFFAGPIDMFPECKKIIIEDVDLDWEFHLVINKYAYLNRAAETFIAYTWEALKTRTGITTLPVGHGVSGPRRRK
jgi:DNA-binding transcriptional LysR family regulator